MAWYGPRRDSLKRAGSWAILNSQRIRKTGIIPGNVAASIADAKAARRNAVTQAHAGPAAKSVPLAVSRAVPAAAPIVTATAPDPVPAWNAAVAAVRNLPGHEQQRAMVRLVTGNPGLHRAYLNAVNGRR